MSDVTLRDQAVSHLRKTTIPYPKWAARAPRATDQWKQAFDLIGQISPSADLTAAVAELKATTASYPNWVKSVNAGAYTPTDGSGTHWGKSLAALARIGAVTPSGDGPALVAAFPPLPAPRKVVANRTLGNTDEDEPDVLYRHTEHLVSGTGHGIVVYGGAKRVVLEGTRIHDAPGQSKTEGHDGSRQGIATYTDAGAVEDLRVIRGEAWDIGGQKWSHGLYFDAVKRGLVQAHYAHDIGDFVHQWYPGKAGVDSKATAVNVTVGWPRGGPYAVVVWAENGTWEGEYRNSIIWGDIMLRGDAELRLHNCIVPPQFDIDDGVILDNVLRIDPKLDAQRRPTAPDAFALADSDWMPALAYDLSTFTRPVVGSHAA